MATVKLSTILQTESTIGYSGSRGPVGFTGSTGFVGSKGDTGFVGSQGDTGFVGSQGGTYGGGAGGMYGSVRHTGVPISGGGAVRIVWGGKSYPNNAA
jgi:hypothetical protein